MRNFIVLLMSFIFLACSNQQKMTKEKLTESGNALPVFDMEGHRGCRGLMPENTIPAMLKAIDLGVTTLEMDVVITKDKKVVLSHEPYFDNEITTKPDGNYIKDTEEKSYNIYKMDYAEVLKYDVGLKPHPRFPQQQKMKAVKPLLNDLIGEVESYLLANNKTKVFYNIETKSMPAGDNIFHPKPAEFVDLLMKVIDEKGIRKRVIIQSFDFRTLMYLHKNYPGVKTAMLVEDSEKKPFEELLTGIGFVPTIYSPAYSMVNESLVEKCHQKGIKIIPWTVNDKATIIRLKAMAVDGIITDYPNLFNQ
jgi:glycerophosphoryl diester phosphodiesterase